MTRRITTRLGHFDRRKFDALLNVRASTLHAIRSALQRRGYTEVSTASLVNIAGSCENPSASFRIDYYGRPAHLSQSAQLQLEALVLRLRRPVFTVNSSFREENYDDPEARGRRLSEFTLVEAERPYEGVPPTQALNAICAEEEVIVRETVERVASEAGKDLRVLGRDPVDVARVTEAPFGRVTYDEALAILGKRGIRSGGNRDLGIGDERQIIEHFKGRAVFVTHHPAKIKFFNMKRTADGGRAFSVDLLLPPLGETIGGAVREEDGEKIQEQYRESRVAAYVQQSTGDALGPFQEYFDVFEEEKGFVRGGFGIGFERLVAFLINTTDILDTIAYRTLKPDSTGS